MTSKRFTVAPRIAAGLRELLVLMLLVVSSVGAVGAPAQDLGERNYSGQDAGVLVMSFTRGKPPALALTDHSVEFYYQRLDHSVTGMVRHVLGGSKSDFIEEGNETVIF